MRRCETASHAKLHRPGLDSHAMVLAHRADAASLARWKRRRRCSGPREEPRSHVLDSDSHGQCNTDGVGFGATPSAWDSDEPLDVTPSRCSERDAAPYFGLPLAAACAAPRRRVVRVVRAVRAGSTRTWLLIASGGEQAGSAPVASHTASLLFPASQRDEHGKAQRHADAAQSAAPTSKRASPSPWPRRLLISGVVA